MAYPSNGSWIVVGFDSLKVYLSYLMRELIYSTSQRSAGELEHVVQQVA